MVDTTSHDNCKQLTTHDPKRKYTWSLLKPIFKHKLNETSL